MSLPWRGIALALLGACAAIYAAVALTWPLGWDQGVFAWVGETMARGGWPFRDAWDVKGPASYLPFAFVSATLGPEPWAYRMVDLLALAGGATALWAVVRSLGFRPLALPAALFLGVSQLSFGFWGTLQPDQWAGWLGAGIAASVLREPVSTRRLAMAGGLAGVAVLIKPHYGFLLVLPLITLREWTPRRLGALAGGFAVPLAACVGVFVVGGSLRTFLDAYLLFNLDAWRLDEFQSVSTLRGLRRAWLRLPLLVPLTLLGITGVAMAWRLSRRHAMVLGVWSGGMLLGVVAQGRWFIYQWGPAFPALIACGAAALGLAARPRRGGSRLLVGVLGSVAFMFASRDVARATTDIAYLLVERPVRSEYLERFLAPVPEYSAAGMERTAEAVAAATMADECVLVWSDPVINVLSRRPTPSRFATFVPLTMGALTPRRARYREEFLRTLIDSPPDLILVDTFTIGTQIGERGSLRERFPEFLDLVRQRYDSTGSLGKYTAWTSRSGRRSCQRGR